MIIGTGKIYLYVNWVHSLKEKRMIVKSTIAKVKNKFNVSVAEVENQDLHQSIVIGIACVSNDFRHANSVIQNVLDFIEDNTEAIVEKVEMDIL
ncbi:DUF503 domain-containing protein [Clostridium bowmanii]|uniref:DUF503 domain-containing protein n=1 Tax=Clostridium bowmanii TaxID=132925 RepID=UPI001C0B7D6F|nr:DUF503 domain-containing protein [Clostridium bowmanii]MBU3190916.1 DUF503 domain-containing protein [Clostridium bowmanii]MCA1075176.1 DUF503 domain-containing protein [Clostridium bowmanii]